MFYHSPKNREESAAEYSCLTLLRLRSWFKTSHDEHPIGLLHSIICGPSEKGLRSNVARRFDLREVMH